MILGLDFDGVLHPVRSMTEPKFCRLALLEVWLRERPEVQVLVTSSWRTVHSFDEILSYFAEDVQERVIGTTPELLLPTKHTRQTEIEAWLAGTRSRETWVALDDDPTQFEPGCRHLVVCNTSVGLTSERLCLLHDVASALMEDESEARRLRFEARRARGEPWQVNAVVTQIIPELDGVTLADDDEDRTYYLSNPAHEGLAWHQLALGQRVVLDLGGSFHAPKVLNVRQGKKD